MRGSSRCQTRARQRRARAARARLRSWRPRPRPPRQRGTAPEAAGRRRGPGTGRPTAWCRGRRRRGRRCNPRRRTGSRTAWRAAARRTKRAGRRACLTGRRRGSGPTSTGGRGRTALSVPPPRRAWRRRRGSRACPPPGPLPPQSRARRSGHVDLCSTRCRACARRRSARTPSRQGSGAQCREGRQAGRRRQGRQGRARSSGAPRPRACPVAVQPGTTTRRGQRGRASARACP